MIRALKAARTAAAWTSFACIFVASAFEFLAERADDLQKVCNNRLADMGAA